MTAAATPSFRPASPAANWLHYALAVPVTRPAQKPFLLIHDTPTGRKILAVVRNSQLSPEEFKRQASREVCIPARELSILSEQEPRTLVTPKELASMQTQFEIYRHLADLSDDEDTPAVATLYRRLTSAGVPIEGTVVSRGERLFDLDCASSDDDPAEHTF